MIGGREVVRQAVPAEDMMQAFIYHHLVPAKTPGGGDRARAVSRRPGSCSAKGR